MNSPTFQVVLDPEGGHHVVDMREGLSIAWRECLESAAAVVAHLNACYPAGVPAPAWDSLVHEVREDHARLEPVVPLHLLHPVELVEMIPEAIGGPLDSGLWRPDYERESK